MFICIIFSNSFILIILYISKKFFKSILIRIDLKGINNIRGPGNFIRGINHSLPFISSKCIFISSDYNESFQKPDYLYLPWPMFNESEYDDLVKNNI